MNRRTSLLVLALVLVLLTGARARADSVLLGTDFNDTALSADAVYADQFVAQQFTLTSPIHLSSISVLTCCNFSGGSAMTFWLTDQIGSGTTPLNVLGSATILNAAFKDPNSLAISGDLSAGTYYLVASSAGLSNVQGWWPSNTVLPSSVGTVATAPYLSQGALNTNPAFPPASSWTNINTGTQPMAFQLIGTTIPEPASIVLLAAGLLAGIARKKFYPQM